ncbi:MAG: DUF4124 domain-containing protein [Casimicrobiaceae bacterium]|nr:DUF4124 domain-containing protein [Casimicrobiaceae bacterium]MDW8311224.1 DUF4124 domain-containing protein [Burkholderiales bacterium]
MIASALAVAAQAQLYRWVDEQGRVQYSDTLPPQATDRARAKLRPDGIVLEKVERAPTAEEKRAQALREEQLARERAAREARERLDRALLDRYASIAEFDRAAERTLKDLDDILVALASREPTLTARIRQLLAGGGPKPGSKEMFELRLLQTEAENLSKMLTARIAAREQQALTLREERERLARLLAEKAGRPTAEARRP